MFVLLVIVRIAKKSYWKARMEKNPCKFQLESLIRNYL
jgi:hypothetical protein